ncbi:methyl-accepting chemotaxis protein [Limnohabitans radicicola]|uniref:Cache domain-containing protein n=1 Tax=Limnohabitans radicicola TaxID=2771427 RepID=A0A927FFG0_9BURK|nr:methyl-accepting chemotaxis protein [Limnohabitans radicicola]MBD8050454.1 cache domain-containing protein [Limnohabitans radicicola]
MNVKSRLIMGGVCSLVGLVLVSVVALYIEKSTLLEDRKIKTRHLVETVHAVVNHFQAQQKAGTMSESDAQAAAMGALKALRYETKEYFWINDQTQPVPRMLMHPTVPALDGKVLDAPNFNSATSQQFGVDAPVEKTDGKKNIFVAFNEVASRAGQGFVTYNWPKPKAEGGTTTELYEKLSYVKKVDGWNWVVGTGIYIDDVEVIFWQHATQFSILVLLVMLVIGAVIQWQIKSIIKPLQALRNMVTAVETSSDFSRRIKDISDDEVGQTARAFNQLMSAQQLAIVEVNKAVEALAAGNFDVEITAGLQGDLRTMKDAVNASAQSVRATMAALAEVMSALYNGDFSQRMSSQVKGDLRGQVDQAMEAMQALLGDVARVMNDVAAGDLTGRITADGRGELARLKANINQSLDALTETMRNVHSNTRQVAAAANQTSQAISQISDGAQNQMHGIAQLANAVKETAASVTDVSRNTEAASSGSRESVAIVRNGKAKMATMVEVVNGIAANSEKINKITEVIEGIANKTNLLSLNAAIEAARAGEHGKGFSVVAEEVGKLAASSAESTQEIALLVQQAVAEARRAVATVQEVSADMERIEAGATEADGMMQRISAALEEQSNAVQEINANVSTLNRIAQSNASASEEITATVIELSKIADSTRREVDQFKI